MNLVQLVKTGRQINAPTHRIIQTSDEEKSLMLVESGFVKRYIIKNDGTLSIQSIYGPGNIFPLTWVFKDLYDMELYTGPEIVYYETMTSSKVFAINSEELIRLINDNNQLFSDLLLVAGERLNSNIQALENLSLPSAYHRVAHQILYYAKVFGDSANNENVKILLPLTHQDIANVLSITRETTSLSMGHLKARKLILYKSKSITVPNIKILQEEAYSGT